MRSVAVETVSTPKAEAFYWATIMFFQTLGGALVFAAALGVVAALHFRTGLSRTLLFCAAFILIRPLGATVGDLLEKPVANGGLALGRFTASVVLLTLMAGLVMYLPRRAGRHPGDENGPGRRCI